MTNVLGGLGSLESLSGQIGGTLQWLLEKKKRRGDSTVLRLTPWCDHDLLEWRHPQVKHGNV